MWTNCFAATARPRGVAASRLAPNRPTATRWPRSSLSALHAGHRGERVPWVQRCADTGAVIGTTSYYDVDEATRSLAIGHTFLGPPWWRTGVNTEAKLLLLSRAFEDLGAVRVVWHTDIRNERSQRAIERLGATREGVLRRHKPRPDGTWRDTVQYAMTVDEWPAVRDRLRAYDACPLQDQDSRASGPRREARTGRRVGDRGPGRASPLGRARCARERTVVRPTDARPS